MSEKESDNNSGLARPNKLPAMRTEDVKARAQRILDLRGKPPYTKDTFGITGQVVNITPVTEDEAAVLSEFVHYWMPYLVQKKDA